MFAYIKGQLVMMTPTYVVIETHGVGYKICIPASVFGKLPQCGSEALLHVSYVVRELSQTLYGFLSTHECELFDKLMDVSGIGPKLALSIIGHMSLPDLYHAINQSNIPAICKIPGIGKKTAERLLIELRDKLPPMPSEYAVPLPKQSQCIQDAMSALVHLGYHQAIAQKAIKQVIKEHGDEVELTKLITLSLKHVS